jgi:hypothetical protein
LMFREMVLNSIWFRKLENNKNFQCKWNTIDTAKDYAYITTERMGAFQFTNAFTSSRLVGVYAQQKTQSKLVDFEGIVAGVSLDVYLLTLITCCLLVGLFAFIEYMRPFHSEFYFWHVTAVILPCFNCQEPALEHNNSPARAVAIIFAGIFVFLCTTYRVNVKSLHCFR